MEQKNNLTQQVFIKGINKDASSSLMPENELSHLRNGVCYAHDGNFLFVQMEQANKLICTLPFPIIGHTQLPDGKWCLFLTNDIDSEIGVFDEQTYIYTTYLNKRWLNFKKSNLISARSKQNADGSFSIYWADGRRNPDRILNLSDVSNATYDNVRFSKIITPPIINITDSTGGVLPNGAYQAAIQYTINKQPFGQVYSLTLPTYIYHEDSTSIVNRGAIKIEIDNIDNDFEEFNVILIQSSKSTSVSKVVGNFSRNTSVVHISNFERPEYTAFPIEDLSIYNIPILASDQITGNNQHLFRIGTELVPDPNYQLQCFQIESEYVIWQADESYYSYGNNVGHYRDETYRYSIQLLHKLGFYSSSFHVPGRKAATFELAQASGTDVYETNLTDCEEKKKIPYYKVYNTASKPTYTQEKETICDGIEIGYGKMAYTESTDTYPYNIIQFGENVNTPIRDHKFPDEDIVPRYTTKNGKVYINILGIRFKNIPHPLKETGELDTNWVGYRIIRADRDGNRSIISRGMLTNVRSYTDDQNQNKEIHYTNYPFNDLRPDGFLSSKQTSYISKERYFTPLTTYYKNKFNYYSPHCYIGKWGLGEEIKIESEEVAKVDGSFSEVYKHPKHKLLSKFSFWLATVIGSLEAFLTTSAGGRDVVSKSEKANGVINQSGLTTNDGIVTPGKVTVITPQAEKTTQKPSGLEGLLGTSIWDLIKDIGKGGGFIKVARKVIQLIGTLSLKGLIFVFTGIQYANNVIRIIDEFLGYTNYTLQYNGHADFNKSTSVRKGFKRRFVSIYRYLSPGINTINSTIFNNFKKHESVYIELNEDVDDFKNVDNSRSTLSELNLESPFSPITSQAVAFYATSKRNLQNQYGKVESTYNFYLVHNNYFMMLPENKDTTYESPVLFGGDCFINRFSVQTKHQFFSQNQSEPYLFSTPKDGEEFDYRLYRNIAYPRFWANFFKYDFSELIGSNPMNFSRFSSSVTSRHNLDNKGKDKTNQFRVDDAYFYISSNGVMNFIVESDYNLAFREPSKNDTYFYSCKFTDLKEIFREDRLHKSEEFHYDFSLSKQADQFFAVQQETTYNPSVYNTTYKYSPNKIAYSLPSYQEQQYDNWRYFLNNNSYEFPMSEFGKLTGVHRVDGQRLLFLFDRSSPYITLGTTQLEATNDLTVTIGDGGVFAQPPRELLFTEQHYGNSQSKWATISTPYGTFYPSERQGRWLQFSQNLDEVTKDSLYMWSKEYFPIKLLQYFPNFKDIDNPVCGVGYISACDTTLPMLYLTKKDYIPKTDLNYPIEYDFSLNKFTYNGIEVELKDKNYFQDCSFTIGWSPITKQWGFQDWHPDWVISTERHFITSKENKLYLHNNDPFRYCNYYDVQYPFEVEWVSNSKFSTDTLSNIEYYLDCEKFIDRNNKTNLLNENFSHLIVHNSEQISGLSRLVYPLNPQERIAYPKISPSGIGMDVLYEKKENRYRVNYLRDLRNNRLDNFHLMHISPNGYVRNINPKAINVNKHPSERKMFRGYTNFITLLKEIPSNIRYTLKLAITRTVKSDR